MPVLIVTGPSAAGKNTVAASLAPLRQRCALIDVDVVRWMVVQPHRAPWEGMEGLAQQQLGVRNACLLADSFVEAGYDVVILDVLSDATAQQYRVTMEAHAPRIVRLLPAWEEVVRRSAIRGLRLQPHEERAIYDQQQRFTAYDETIDTTTLSATAVAAQLSRMLDEAALSEPAA